MKESFSSNDAKGNVNISVPSDGQLYIYLCVTDFWTLCKNVNLLTHFHYYTSKDAVRHTTIISTLVDNLVKSSCESSFLIAWTNSLYQLNVIIRERVGDSIFVPGHITWSGPNHWCHRTSCVRRGRNASMNGLSVREHVTTNWTVEWCSQSLTNWTRHWRLVAHNNHVPVFRGRRGDVPLGGGG